MRSMSNYMYSRESANTVQNTDTELQIAKQIIQKLRHKDVTEQGGTAE